MNYGLKLKLQFLELTLYQSSPSACEALFFCGSQVKVCGWGWQTCRLNIIVKVKWTVQFKDYIVVFISWRVVRWFSVFNDLSNLSDLGLKSIWELIPLNSFLIVTYLSSTVSFKRSSSDPFTNVIWAMCCRQYGGWIQDSSTASIFLYYLPWDGWRCILTSNNSITILHKWGHVS